MAILSKQSPTKTGANLTMTTVAPGGDSYPNHGNELLLFRNATGGAITVTVDSPAVDNFGFSGNALDRTFSVPDGAERFLVGPFSTQQHNDANGRVQLTYSAPGLQVAVIAR